MSTLDQVGGRSRWEIAQESTLALARKAEQFDRSEKPMQISLNVGKYVEKSERA